MKTEYYMSSVLQDHAYAEISLIFVSDAFQKQDDLFSKYCS